MIKTETVTINEVQYSRTYSTTGYMIERDGVEYVEAIDPLNSGREYTETCTLVESDEDISAEDALQIIVGGESA